VWPVNVNCSSEYQGHEEETVLVTIRSEDDSGITTVTIKWIVIIMIKKFFVCVQPKDNYTCALTRTICTTPATYPLCDNMLSSVSSFTSITFDL
jgi:hypothetical protein